MRYGWGGIPQGLKPHFVRRRERPKAEALGYLEAKADFLPDGSPRDLLNDEIWALEWVAL
jgi:hypothetical protein